MSSVIVEDSPKIVEKKAVVAPRRKPLVRAAAKPDPKMPGKFAGKSASEVAQAFEHLEKELGRKNNEVGELRKLSDSFLQAEISRNSGNNPIQEATTETTVDFYDEPERAVNSAIENHPEFRKLKKAQVQQEQKESLSKLKAKHPDFEKVIKDPKFQEYAQGSVTRRKMYKEADAFNVDSAEELINGFKGGSAPVARKSNTDRAKQLAEAKRRLALKKGSTQSRASAGAVGGKKTFRRADLIRLKTNDPNKYDAMQDEIFAAYADNRVK
jgi:hypothetical protein